MPGGLGNRRPHSFSMSVPCPFRVSVTNFVMSLAVESSLSRMGMLDAGFPGWGIQKILDEGEDAVVLVCDLTTLR